MSLMKKCSISLVLALCLVFAGCDFVTPVDLMKEQKIQKIEKGMSVNEVCDVLGKWSYDYLSGVDYPLCLGWQIHENCVLKITFTVDGCESSSDFSKIKLEYLEQGVSSEDWVNEIFKASSSYIERRNTASEEVLFE